MQEAEISNCFRLLIYLMIDLMFDFKLPHLRPRFSSGMATLPFIHSSGRALKSHWRDTMPAIVTSRKTTCAVKDGRVITFTVFDFLIPNFKIATILIFPIFVEINQYVNALSDHLSWFGECRRRLGKGLRLSLGC